REGAEIMPLDRGGRDPAVHFLSRLLTCGRRPSTITSASQVGDDSAMITVEFVRLMAAYNSEMNRRIYAGAARLTDAQRQEDRGLFWKSLHGTLNHLLWADRQWMSRLDGWPPNTIPGPQSATLIDDFSTLREERVKTD